MQLAMLAKAGHNVCTRCCAAGSYRIPSNYFNYWYLYYTLWYVLDTVLCWSVVYSCQSLSLYKLIASALCTITELST